jgi:amidohydrolase
MIDYGVLEGIEAILALHVDPTRAVGHVGLRSGTLTANCDAMRLTIHGRGGHAARPHETIDSIAIAAQLISSLYQFVPRATDSQDAVVVTIGQIAGGDNPNVIPEYVHLYGTLRTLDRTVRLRTVDHIRQLARGMAEASGSQIDVQIDPGVGSVRNDARLIEMLRSVASDVLGRDAVERIARPSMGSEDFAYYLDHVPGALARLGCSPAAAGSTPLHTPCFDIDEHALGYGAKILARAAVTWSLDHAV